MILVTGGAGFIGSHIVDALLAEGCAVRVLDSLLAHTVLPGYLAPEADLLEGDLRDPLTVERALAGVEHVCHQAGMVGLGSDFLDIADYVSHNDTGTAVLLRAIAAAGFSGRLVLASSMVVYGEGRYACLDHGVVRPAPRLAEQLDAGRFEPGCPHCGRELEAQPIPEQAELDPRNVYAATKLHQEHLAAALEREAGVPVTALRYHNVYGPRMPRDTPYAGVASLFASALAAGVAPRVFEDGAQRRDFVHVRDVALANLAALTSAEPVTGALNIASGQPRSVGEMAQALAQATGPGAPRPLVTGEYRMGDVRHVFASPERAQRLLGFRAQEDFAQGMRELARAELRR
ncbi:MAG: NAD-dependent epimerase/dehydratase family protein [Solirubrobacteraceae bacterium]